MAALFYQRSLQAGEQESESFCSGKSWCGACLKQEGCSWCNGNSQSSGSCQVLEDPTTTCSEAITTDGSQCPSVGADVVLRNVSGLLGAMVGVAIILNVVNRFSNKRRNAKLKRSIFTLPVYVYPSKEKKAAAVKIARELLHSPTASGTKDIEEADFDETTDDEGCEGNAQVTCAICLAAYEEKEVIKVLPCGHDFHSGCLDSWLECKATCPLCKMPAFTKNRDTPRRGNAASPVHAVSPPPRTVASRPLSCRSLPAVSISPDQPRNFESGSVGLEACIEADVESVELHAMAITSPQSMPTGGNSDPRSEAVQAVDELVAAGGGGARLEGVGEGYGAGTELVRGEKSQDESKTTCGSDTGSDAGSVGGSNGGSGSDNDSVPADDAGFAASDGAANSPNGGDANESDAHEVGGGVHLQGVDKGVDVDVGVGVGVDMGSSATPSDAPIASTTTTAATVGYGCRQPPCASSGDLDVYLYDVEAGQPASARAVAVADGPEG